MKKYIIDVARSPIGAGSNQTEAIADAAKSLEMTSEEVADILDNTANKIRLGGIGQNDDLFWADDETCQEFEEEGI